MAKHRRFIFAGVLCALVCAASLIVLAPHESAAEGSALPHRAMIPQLASDSATGLIVVPTATAVPLATATPKATPTTQAPAPAPYSPPAPMPGPGHY